MIPTKCLAYTRRACSKPVREKAIGDWCCCVFEVGGGVVVQCVFEKGSATASAGSTTGVVRMFHTCIRCGGRTSTRISI